MPLSHPRFRLAPALIALALALRILVPAGFMPAAGQGFAITLCTGMGTMPAWVDDEGRIHKGKPAPDRPPEHPCAFAGIAAALTAPDGFVVLSMPPFAAAAPLTLPVAVMIGHGLAAPPPPPTGPPSSL